MAHTACPASLGHVAAWLKQCCLQLNVTKTVCMFFSKSKTHTIPPDVYISGEKLQVVTEYKYLGIMIDSRLSFKSQVKRVCDRVKFSLSNFGSIRCQPSPEAAKMYMHSMISSQMMYCFTTWSRAGISQLKPLQSLHKQVIKTPDKKPRRSHRCPICSAGIT